MNELKQIQAFADRAHGTQTRKYSSDRYIVHPVRVMELCSNYTDNVTILAAALLHDVLEDTATTDREIADFLTPLLGSEQAQHVLRLVIELTDVYVWKKYPNWNRQERKELECLRMATISADAQTIKYADIIDNCEEITTEDPGFARKYLKECRHLLSVIPVGNPELYHRACNMIEGKMKELFNRR